MNHIKKFWVMYGAVIMGAMPYAVPYVTSWVTAHPKVATDLASLAVILAKVSKSPSQANS